MPNIEEFFKEEFEAFENEDIKAFTLELLETAPEYFWEVAASSTGKFHPSYSLGYMGLARHVKAATRFLNHLLSLEHIQNRLDSRQRDCLRCAIMNHDDEKLGRNGSQYTVFKHPILIADRIRAYKDYEWLPDEELDYIADVCASHMGEWNTDKRSKDVLPKPETFAQQLVHEADYLASRKDLEVHFDDSINQIAEESLPNPETYILTFGKHEGTALADVPVGYLRWLKENYKSEPIKSMVDKLV